jgi:hypothetical protein
MPTNTSATPSLPSVSMDYSKKTENYTNQGAVNSPLGKLLIVNDFFYVFTTLAFVRLPWMSAQSVGKCGSPLYS